MTFSLIGKTNGAASSEFQLGSKVVNIITAMAALAVAVGGISPEHAPQVTELAIAASGIMGSMWALYAAIRGIIKSIISWHESGVEDEAK